MSSILLNRRRMMLMQEHEYQGLMLKSSGSTSISMTNIDNTPDLQYSLNGGKTWTQWDYSSISLSNGDTVCFKGNNPNGISGKDSQNVTRSSTFVVTGNGTVAASGNVMSLIDDGACNTLTIPDDYCFYKLFYGCTSLTSAPLLPATTITLGCYHSMFRGCTSLVNAPSLPALDLSEGACYSSMFEGCSSLVNAPELPATSIGEFSYSEMFAGCTALANAPTVLPANQMEQFCYYKMFENCTSLTSTPQLPATQLAASCYCCMFYGCTSLASAPRLSAMTMKAACYSAMFYGCTSLTTAPNLPATTLAGYCYHEMFYGCTNLTSAPEELPATVLQVHCYSGMFSGCISLTKAPDLQSPWLHEYCYRGMFYGCTNLQYIYCMTSASAYWGVTSPFSNWVTGVPAGGTMYIADGSLSSWPRGDDGIPNGWDVQQVITPSN